jgi:hypothetical protein
LCFFYYSTIYRDISLHIDLSLYIYMCVCILKHNIVLYKYMQLLFALK